jgi:hypothetical protein
VPTSGAARASFYGRVTILTARMPRVADLRVIEHVRPHVEVAICQEIMVVFAAG